MTLNAAAVAGELIIKRAQGKTLREIGDEYGVTRERIRQIIARHDPGGFRYEARRKEFLDSLSTILPDYIRDYADAHPNMPSGQMAHAITKSLGWNVLSVTRDDVESAIGIEECKRRHRDIYINNHTHRIYTDEEIILALQRVHAALGRKVMGLSRYRNFAESCPGEIPSAALIVQRFGYWKDACTAAGIPYGATHFVYTRQWTDEDMYQIVIDFINDPDVPSPSAENYDQYARARKGVVPSLATIRNRMGKWTQIVSNAYERMENADV